MPEKSDQSAASMGEKIRVLVEWAPAVSMMANFKAAKTPRDKADAAVAIIRWVAGKSQTKVDDEFAEHLAAVFATPQGEAMLAWAMKAFS